MNNKTTLPRIYWHLMDGPTIDPREHPYCAVCGRSGHVVPLNSHHYVWRSWGELFPEGRGNPKPLRKPTVPLCGSGNVSGCHRLAHERRLHFDTDGDGNLYYLLTETTDYATALEEQGWRLCK